MKVNREKRTHNEGQYTTKLRNKGQQRTGNEVQQVTHLITQKTDNKGLITKDNRQGKAL